MREHTTDALALAAGLTPVAALLGPFVTVPQADYINITVVCVLALSLCLALRLRGERRPELFGPMWPFALYFILLMGYALVSLVWVRDIQFSFLNTLCIQLSGVAMLLAIAAGVRSREDLLWLLDVLTVCLSLVVLLGCFEIFTGRYLFPNDNPELYLKNIYGRFFPYATFHNTNNYSAFVTLTLPFAVYDLVCRLGGRKGALCGVLLGGVSIFTLLNADPRACYIGIAVMAVAFVAALPGRVLRSRGMVPVWLALLAGAGLVAARKGGKLLTELHTLNLSNHSVSERLMLTRAAFRMMPDYHFMGVGAGNYIQLLPYYSPSIKHINLHNMTLQILTEYGIPMFVLYVAVLVALAVGFFRRRRAGGRDGLLAVVGFMTVCAFPVVGIAASDATRDATTWIFLGVLLAARKRLLTPQGITSQGITSQDTPLGGLSWRRPGEKSGRMRRNAHKKLR